MSVSERTRSEEHVGAATSSGDGTSGAASGAATLLARQEVAGAPK